MTDKILIDRSMVEQALEAFEQINSPYWSDFVSNHIAALRAALEQPKQTLKDAAMKAGITISDTYIPSMEDAIAAGDSVLINEQATLLRECRLALNSLIKQKPTLAGLRCGSTTLGNLKADLYAYRPRGVMGTSELEQPQVEQEPVACHVFNVTVTGHLTEWEPTTFAFALQDGKHALYTHPQNLNCKSTQHRLATLWGYEKPQTPRQPLTDEQIDALYIEGRQHWLGKRQIARAVEAAHGIGEKR